MNQKKAGMILAAAGAIAGIGAAAVAVMNKNKRNKKNQDNEKDKGKESGAKRYVGSDMPENEAPADPVYRDRVKRAIDLAICIPAFAVAAIPMVITGLASLLSMKGQKNIENMCSGVVGAFFSPFLAV